MVFARAIIVAVISALMPLPLMAAQGDDPGWPCIQRKVPQLSIGQIWTGPDLPPQAADWAKDADLAELVEDLAARRLPIAEAQQKIRAFRDGLQQEPREKRRAMLVQGLFETMNGERAHVISGIARYAHRQRDMAASLRAEGAALDALRAKPDADQAQLSMRGEQLVFRTRIFQERVQALTYVCEVPTLIEQRLYALVKVLGEPSPPK